MNRVQHTQVVFVLSGFPYPYIFSQEHMKLLSTHQVNLGFNLHTHIKLGGICGIINRKQMLVTEQLIVQKMSL